MELLDSPIRKYAWGSRSAIATLQGRPTPTPDPEAELWMGAHPASPSRLAVSGTPLVDAIAADPVKLLGPANVERFGARLPFLLKVLAAATPLSLQAHPDAAYAKEAFARQEADPAAPKNYTDAYHKPEMLVALTPFEGASNLNVACIDIALLKATIVDLGDLDPGTYRILSPGSEAPPVEIAID